MVISFLLKNYDKQTTTVRRLIEPLVFPVGKGKFDRKGVPAFSILKPRQEVDFNASGQRRRVDDVSVRVISLPNEQALQEMESNRRLRRAVSSLPIADHGDEGTMKLGALRSVEEFVFKVKDLKSLKDFPKIEEYLAGASVRFVANEQGYLARECCDPQTQKCINQFSFEVFEDEHPTKVRQSYFDNTLDGVFFANLFPIQTENLPAMSQILKLIEEPQFDFIDFRYFDTRGFVKVPLEMSKGFRTSKGELVPEMQEGPLNTLHYLSDDPHSNDAFGHPTSICAFLQAVKTYNKSCSGPECRVQWGDFYHSDKWYTHSDHHEGTCVDVRPVRKTEGYHGINVFRYVDRCKKDKQGVETCTRVSVLNPEYDRAKTQELIDAFVAAGGVGKASEDGKVLVEHILFNDTKGIKGVTSAPGHHNHMHVCFPNNSEKVKKACEVGI